ncbi:MAG: class I SAM-dependent methyltransferase [Candidatus Yanofskybacteria bacterium]|nr:class I SAM-dependent methyltransferase [Candidatus Yanofskybacteria bacterium]
MRNILRDYKIFDIDPTRSRSKDFYKNMLDYRDHTMKQYHPAIKRAGFKCLLCGKSRAKEFLEYENYKLFDCLSCGLVSPNIDLEKLKSLEIYDDPAYIKDATREILDTYNYRKGQYAPERLNYILQKTKLSPNKIKLLDLGCGPGYFLSYLKNKKIKYKGLELANFLVKICKQKNLNVEGSDLRKEVSQSYNVITMFDVLEHLTDPVGLFKDLNNKIVKGGYVLAYTPNIHSLAYSLMKERQNTLYPFQHLAFFDNKSLNYLAKKTGFKVFSIDYFGLDVADYLYMKAYDDAHDYLEKLKDFIPTMQAVIDKQNLSNHMRIIFKKIKNV